MARGPGGRAPARELSLARFLVDECLPRSVALALTAAGYDAEDARDVGLRGKSDELVHERALAHDRILLTADLDFANALRFPPGSHPGIVVLRVPEEWRPAERTARLVAGLAEAGWEQMRGAIVIVEPARTRLFRRDPAAG